MKIGVIGYGTRIRMFVDHLMKVNPECHLVAITDPLQEEIKGKMGDEAKDVQFFLTPEEMMDRVELDGILIGTRCNLHTEMALKVLSRGIPLFLEKPVATTYSDLIRLKKGFEATKTPVVVSFPLRNTPLLQFVKEIVDSGKLGTIEHVQAVNNVTYGGVYYHNWYRDETITGGLFLQKATHDFDYINYLIGLKAETICAMKSKQIFKGNKPAGLTCEKCDERHICPESTIVNGLGAYCCFGVDTGNEDSGSAIIQYESGMHAVYTQNFFVRNKAGKRGARLLGYKGTLEFDWYTSEVKVYMHHVPRVEIL
jgi:predicted dehydrogenase